MAVSATTEKIVELPEGGRWIIGVQVTDDDGCAVDVEPTITVTLPGGTTSPVTPEDTGDGDWRGVYVAPATTGRYVARAEAAGYGVVDFVAYVQAVTSQAGMPTLANVLNYLGWAEDTDDDDAATALATEAAAQRAICRVGAIYPDDLRGALYRRVARNLAMKKLPVAVLRGDGESGDTVLPGNDPEVKRLERPHRKVILR
jgi:hypothetical protein